MINQIMNRQFVVEQLEEVKAHLEEQTKEGQERRQADALPEGAEDLSIDDYKTTLDLVAETIEREEKESSGQSGFDTRVDAVDFATNEHHVFSRTNRTVDHHADICGFQHCVRNFKALGNARCLHDANCAAVAHICH